MLSRSGFGLSSWADGHFEEWGAGLPNQLGNEERAQAGSCACENSCGGTCRFVAADAGGLTRGFVGQMANNAPLDRPMMGLHGNAVPTTVFKNEFTGKMYMGYEDPLPEIDADYTDQCWNPEKENTLRQLMGGALFGEAQYEREEYDPSDFPIYPDAIDHEMVAQEAGRRRMEADIKQQLALNKDDEYVGGGARISNIVREHPKHSNMVGYHEDVRAMPYHTQETNRGMLEATNPFHRQVSNGEMHTASGARPLHSRDRSDVDTDLVRTGRWATGIDNLEHRSGLQAGVREGTLSRRGTQNEFARHDLSGLSQNGGLRANIRETPLSQRGTQNTMTMHDLNLSEAVGPRVVHSRNNVKREERLKPSQSLDLAQAPGMTASHRVAPRTLRDAEHREARTMHLDNVAEAPSKVLEHERQNIVREMLHAAKKYAAVDRTGFAAGMAPSVSDTVQRRHKDMQQRLVGPISQTEAPTTALLAKIDGHSRRSKEFLITQKPHGSLLNGTDGIANEHELVQNMTSRTKRVELDERRDSWATDGISAIFDHHQTSGKLNRRPRKHANVGLGFTGPNEQDGGYGTFENLKFQYE
jgi:hypothetical protein